MIKRVGEEYKSTSTCTVFRSAYLSYWDVNYKAGASYKMTVGYSIMEYASSLIIPPYAKGMTE